MDKQILALYEMKRQSFLIGFIQSPRHFSESLAYAYYHRLAPLFHHPVDSDKFSVDPFADIYSVDKDFMLRVVQFVDECAAKGDFKSVGFVQLEEKFGGYKANRIELVRTLEYARIDRRFEPEVWTAIQTNAPIEANNLASKFTPDDVFFG